MRLCSVDNCMSAVFRTDRNTRYGYCSNHWKQYSTDIDKRSIAEKGIEKARKQKENKASLPKQISKLRGEGNFQDNFDGISRSQLISDIDEIQSKYVRLLAADDQGIISCYICSKPVTIAAAHNMHFISRSTLKLRHDLRNTKAGCSSCNIYKDGNMAEYERKMELEHKGICEQLREQSRVVEHIGNDELKEILSNFRNKYRLLQQTKGIKK